MPLALLPQRGVRECNLHTLLLPALQQHKSRGSFGRGRTEFALYLGLSADTLKLGGAVLWSNADFSLHCALASCKALGTGKGVRAYAAPDVRATA